MIRPRRAEAAGPIEWANNDAPTASRLQRRLTLAAVSVAVFGYVLTILLGWRLIQSSDRLNQSVRSVRDTVTANVRTYSQTQREILRLKLALSEGRSADDIELSSGLVSQRMTEGNTPQARSTLHDSDLVAYHALSYRIWTDQDAPAVAKVADDVRAGNTSPDALKRRQEVLDSLGNLELRANRIATEAEWLRRNESLTATRASENLVNHWQVLVFTQAITLGALVGFTSLALYVVSRVDKARSAAASRLRDLNNDLAKLSEVAENTDNLVVITDAHGLIEWVNSAFVRTTGYSSEEAKGRQPGELLQGPHTDPTTREYMHDCIAQGKAFHTEVLNYTKNGGTIWVALEVRPVTDERGRVRNFIAVQTDVTERRETETQLRRAKDAAEASAKAKSAFLANMSHEIRTPLNAVIGLTGLLIDTDLNDHQRELLEIVRDSGDLLLSVVNNILNYSALEAGGVTLDQAPFSLRETITNTVALFETDAKSKGLSLTSTVDDLPPAVLGDDLRVRQILLNLIANAVKFTSTGSVAITVTCETTEPHASNGSDATPAVAKVRTAVTDSGVGIAPERLDRLFQPFTQEDSSTSRRYGGTGLGLAITKELVELMGGSIRIDSAVGDGTTVTFDIDFPIALRPDDALPAPEAPANQPGGVGSVLIIEDDPVNRKVLELLLARMGIETGVAENGFVALDMVDETTFDAIFVDMQMPEIDGIETMRRIRTKLGAATPPAVALTASAMPGDRERFLMAGLDDYLAKPVRVADLAAALRRVREGGSVTDTRRAPHRPPIDVAALRELVGADTAVQNALVDLFLDEAPGLVDTVESSGKATDRRAMVTAARRLAQSAAGVSAGAVANLARQTELLGAASGLRFDERLADLVDSLRVEVARVADWRNQSGIG